MKDKPAPAACRTLFGEGLHKPLPHTFPGHLDQPEGSHLSNLMLGTVTGQALHKPAQDKVTVLWHDHINKIDHDHTADIAQPQLAHDLLGSFQIALGNRLFKRLPAPNKTACININSRHGFSAVNDQRTARREIYLTFHPFAQLRINRPFIENIPALMLFRIPFFKAFKHIRRSRFKIFPDPAVHIVAFNNQFAEIIIENIPDHTDHNIGLPLEKMGALGTFVIFKAFFNMIPLADQMLHITLQRLFTGTFCSRADNYAHILGSNFINDIFQACALAFR